MHIHRQQFNLISGEKCSEGNIWKLNSKNMELLLWNYLWKIVEFFATNFSKKDDANNKITKLTSFPF